MLTECSVDNCQEPCKMRGLCSSHYNALRRAENARCSIEGCEKAAWARAKNAPAHHRGFSLCAAGRFRPSPSPC